MFLKNQRSAKKKVNKMIDLPNFDLESTVQDRPDNMVLGKNFDFPTKKVPVSI